MSPDWRSFYLCLIVILLQGNICQVTAQSRFKTCCDIGTSWAKEDLRCEKYTGPVPGVPKAEQTLCLEAIDICCVRAYHEKGCEKGKQNARKGLACAESSNINLGSSRSQNNQRDCCEGCKLGILTGAMGQGCTLSDFSFGNPWDPAFLECCNEALTSTTIFSTIAESKKTSTSSDDDTSFNKTTKSLTTLTSTHSSDSLTTSSTLIFEFSTPILMSSTLSSKLDNISTTLSTSDSSTYKFSSFDGQTTVPTPPIDDICVLLKGLLCSHICIPTPGSYYCKCPEGYVLLEDEKTCRTDGPINRCESDNPCEHRCIDTGTDVKCECDPGFHLAKDNHSCELKLSQVNTTTYKTTTKSRDSNKTKSKCPPGYQYNLTARVCDDINECEEQEHLCSEREVCYNQPGGYSCAKLPEPLTEVTTIEDKELSTPNLKNLQKCAEGMKFVRNRGCTDINECEEIEDACTSNEECVNTIGSFTCNCRVGFRRENLTLACVDINECQLQNDCLPSQRCDNTLGSYNCVRFLPCGTGYTLNAATEICEDDDECLLGTHDCGEGYHCRNTLGSYRCDKNLRNQTTRTFSKTTRPLIQSTTVMTKIISRTTTPIIVTERPTIPIAESTTVTPSIDSRFQSQTEPKPCPSGFERGSSGQCNDIDECQRGPANPCAHSPLQRCLNTIGSYRCVSRVICGPGWVLDPATSHCIDVDECAEKSHECGPEQICENRQGGYVCSCPPGHVIGPNKDCIDIDECSVFGSKICGNNGQCVNTPGSYQCTCNEGFQKSRKGTSCQDINECEKTPGICQHDCINIWGSYRCSCRHGFRLHSDKRSCTDINECEEFKENNLCVGICDNTPGSYSCSCPEGYRLGIDGRTCQDIDECATGRVCQNPSEMCQNTRGSFRCNKINCPSGYHLDPQRRNRCVRSSRYCSSDDLACFRSPSHYSYNFITFVSMFPLPPTGQLELFTMRGTHLPGSIMRFSMALVDARAPPGITRATESCFALRRPSPTQAILVLTRMLPGPQEIELDLSMEIYHKTTFAGSAVAKIFIYVTQYEF